MASPASDVSGRVEAARGFPLARLREVLLPSRTMRRRAWPPVLGLAYVAGVGALGGLTAFHVAMGLLGLLDLYNEASRAFLKTFFPFILTGVLFDSMRYYYWQGVAGRIHTAGPYLLERAWFGVGGRTLNELFRAHHWELADLLCGLAYLVYVAEYVGLALLLFLRRRSADARTFARCFLVVNVLGFLTYFAVPVAPPWYVARYGLGPAVTGVPPAPAAAARFDALVGAPVFHDMYGSGFVTFGAMPSLHAAYPLVAFLLACRMPALRWARVPAGLFFLLICFSAIYLQHHYVLDVLAGSLYAVATVAAVAAWERRRAAVA